MIIYSKKIEKHKERNYSLKIFNREYKLHFSFDFSFFKQIPMNTKDALIQMEKEKKKAFRFARFLE